MGRATLRDDDRRLRHESFVGDFEPGDGQTGDWSREDLIEMDRQFHPGNPGSITIDGFRDRGESKRAFATEGDVMHFGRATQ